ncbi:MAG TPA: hypothetical protein VF384_02745 [Planctomycetota bacterium]
MHPRALLSLVATVALPLGLAGQDYQRHAPHLLPAQVSALALDPTADRLAALMQSPVLWQSHEMFHRIGAKWRSGTDAMPAILHLVPDMARRRLVGLQLTFQTLTTWEWDGVAWNNRGTLLLNQAPSTLLACWHEGLGRVMLVDPFLRTLSWDGSQWSQAGGGPPPPSSGGMVYDGARDRLVLFTGSSCWEWDRHTWRQLTFTVLPPSRGEFGFAYDPLRQRALLFGGYAWAHLQDTWQYDGAQWTQLAPMQQPAPRQRQAMAFDPVRERIVMVGGWGFNALGQLRAIHNDEWEWDGQDWQCVQFDRRPPFADPVGMAEDPVGGGVLLTTRAVSSSTRMWRWNGADWFPHSPGSVAPTNVEAMCSDPGRGAIWCFDSGLVSRTWRFDGNAWQQLAPANSPSPRSGAAIAFDRARNVVVLFGGDNYSATFDDTWLWDGVDWSQPSPAHRPPPRYNHTMAFDPISNRVLMCGGVGGLSQPTWAWDGTDWTNLGQPVSTGFTLRMVEHRARGSVMLWNGTGPTKEWNGTAWTLWSATMPAHLQAARYLSGASFGDTLVVFDRANTWVASPHGASVTEYGAGCSTAVVPRLDASGSPTPGTTDFGLVVDRAEPSCFVFLLASLAPASIPIGPCSLLLQAPETIGLALASANGVAAFEMPLPSGAGLFGIDVRWQAVTFGTGGIAFTPGLSTVLGY